MVAGPWEAGVRIMLGVVELTLGLPVQARWSSCMQVLQIAVIALEDSDSLEVMIRVK